MQISSLSYNNHPYRTPPNPPPRKYGKAYHNPSMVETDDEQQGGYPTPAPRSARKSDHPLLRSDSSKYQMKGTGMSLSHLNADQSLSPAAATTTQTSRPSSTRRYTSSTPEQYPSGVSDRSGGSDNPQASVGTTLSSRDTPHASNMSLSHDSQSDAVFLSQQLSASHSLVNRSHNRTFESPAMNADNMTRYRSVPSYNALNVSQSDTLRSILKDRDRSYSDGTRVQHEVQITTPTQYDQSISGLPNQYPTLPYNTDTTNQSLPYHKQNGILSPIRNDATPNQSLHSLELSRISNINNNASTIQSNNVTPPLQLQTPKDELGVRNNLINILTIAVLSLLLSGISLQLVLRLATLSTPANEELMAESVLSVNSYENTREVCVSLCCLVLMLDLSCLMVCMVQAFFALKLLRCLDGYTRTYKYLRGCGSTRFIAITGFFISIPVLLLACLLFVLMEFRATPAIISTVIVIVGIIFITITVTHSAFSWRIEKNKADRDIPAYGTVPLSKNELSTLV